MAVNTYVGSFTKTSGPTTITWASGGPSGYEYLYLLLGDAGTNTFPAKVV